jgi:Na+/H+ antiporter NhaA
VNSPWGREFADLWLALDGELLDGGKIGTLTASAVSAVLGCVLLIVVLPRRARAFLRANV